jgi:hypothetical protein
MLASTQGAFPDNCNAPTIQNQLLLIADVTLDIAFEFHAPECSITRWDRGEFASQVSVPEAAVNENHDLVFREYQVWPPREPPVLKAKAESSSMQQASQKAFWLRMSTANTGHHPGPRCCVDYVRHRDFLPGQN